MPTGTKTKPQNDDLKVMAILRRERAIRQMDQIDLAEMVNISQPQLSRILSGEKPVTLTEFIKICRALELVASEVIREAEKSKP